MRNPPCLRRLNARARLADRPRMGKYVFWLLVLCVILGGGGYYNYQRNAAMDADLMAKRPYREGPKAALMATIASTKKDIARAKGRVAGAPGGESQIDRTDSSDVGGRAQAFAGFQRSNEAWKAQRGAVMEQEVILQELQHEKELRDKDVDRWTRIKRRVLTF